MKTLSEMRENGGMQALDNYSRSNQAGEKPDKTEDAEGAEEKL